MDLPLSNRQGAMTAATNTTPSEMSDPT
jgi:hypothetical protein